ncbi:glycosyltransferase [Fastidiosibacter lacustris]|uniref:glycosyltransferase n=1 Tax=Fastidiosibacter lacustris TaxID=2056695 RepID=UPI00195C58BC|nr:glycosyltransferase [Fastidiosibacter lacustris]
MIKVAHLTSVHSRYDVRVFLKECVSLAKKYNVSLVVADSKGDEVKNAVNIYDVGKLHGRVNRIFKTTKKVLKKALELDADIYHLHDPELLLIAKKLKKAGKKVIFDAHEDLPAQLLSKPYLTVWKARLLSYMAAKYEKMVCSKTDGVVAATPFIRDKFLKINKKTVDINNYPILDEVGQLINWNLKDGSFCYVGGVSKVRGIVEIIQAVNLSRLSKAYIVGGFESPKFEQEVRKGLSKKIELIGWLCREGVREVYEKSIAGFVTLHPIINYVDALPVKMFEYMSAGIPVIASNFALWREIIEGNNCGICVDPMKPEEIVQAINFLIANLDKAEEMGNNGRIAIEEKYNWGNESEKLLKFYKSIELG